MTKRQEQGLNRLFRVKQHFLDNPIAPAIPRVTALITEVDDLAERLQAHGSSQVGGTGAFRGGVSERKLLRKDFQTVLMEMAATARGLDPVQHPGIAEQFRLGRQSDSYQRLIDTASAFHTAATPTAVKALFTDRGFAADFDVQLQAKIAAFAAATGRKYGGLQTLKEGTVGLQVLHRRASAVMKELGAIMVKHLRATNETLLGVWKAAARVYSPPATAPAPEPDPAPSGGGTTPPPSGS